ncbi:MAG: LD-carboxypeptidase [Lentisphaeria bacterium]|nr:LD-carboxypeptidase [Lentisphaeria bacterium]
MKKAVSVILLLTVFCCFAAEKNSPVWKNLFPGMKTIAICAPGLPGKSSEVEQGINNLRAAGYKVKLMPHARENEGIRKEVHWSRRLADFLQAYNDPEVDAIWCVRGGNRSMEVASRVDWSKLRHRKIPVIGFSDITSLHCVMQLNRAGHVFSGPSLTQLIRCSAASVCWFSLAVSKAVLPEIQLEVLRGKDCSGYATGGHLSLFSRAYLRKFSASTDGKIIFLESPRGKIEKFAAAELEKLRKAGCFDRCAAIVFGNIKGKPEQVKKLLSDFAAKVSCPVYTGFPYGHQAENYLLDFERIVSITADGKLRFTTPHSR